MKKRGWIIIGVVVVLLIVINLIFFLPNNSNTIKIGWIGPQTGGSAILGMDSAVTAQIAVDEINSNGGINGKKVELVIEDDQYNTAKSLNAYEKLVNIDGVKIIVIQTYGGVFALAERAKRDGVILIDSLDSNDLIAGLGDHVFSIGVESESIARLIAGNLNDNDFQKVGVIYFNSDTFMPYVKDVFIDEFDGRVIAEGYPAGTNDFRTIISKMDDENIEALILLGYDEAGIAMKQSKELGLEVPFFMPGTVTSPSLQEAAGGNAEGTIFTFWLASNKNIEPAKSYLNKFKEKEGREPIVELFTYPTYDAFKTIEIALTNVDDVNKIEDVKKEILDVEFTGITGPVDFAEDGSMDISFEIFKLVDGAPVKL